MATVLEFRSGSRASSFATKNKNGRGASAEIVFFPGVRFERWEETSQDSKPKRKTKKRDKLELHD